MATDFFFAAKFSFLSSESGTTEHLLSSPLSKEINNQWLNVGSHTSGGDQLVIAYCLRFHRIQLWYVDTREAGWQYKISE